MSATKKFRKKIVAIGGGDIGCFGKKAQTTAIDREIIRLSGRDRPKLLFIPTASGDPLPYCKGVIKHFGKRLGCQVDILTLVAGNPSKREIARKIGRADVIYVGGGNTLKMMKIWKRRGVDRLLKRAYERGKVLSGLSAGSICWFCEGNSDSLKKDEKDTTLVKVSGLGLIPALNCPHYDVEKHRRPSLKAMMKKTRGVAIAIENGCAVAFCDDQFRVLTSLKGKKAYKVYWKGDRFVEEPLSKKSKFQPIDGLFSKQ